ncbi:MAG: motility associated factor glycosyltransferase family protein [Butyrivibrio sp.]|nr:motility associated factor glycosyltransferase family protein [Butyrivibrio sp.]
MAQLQINEELREQNFAAYEARYRRRPVIDPQESDKYRVITARNGEPVLFIRMAGADGLQWVPVNSTYNPSYEASRWAVAEKEDLQNRITTIAMLGFGMGYQLRALLQTMRPDTFYIVYEPEESLFSFICGMVDLTALIKHKYVMILFPSYKEGEFYGYLEARIISDRSQAKGIRLPYYASNAVYEQACAQISISTQLNTNFQKMVARRTFLNHMYAWTGLHRNMLLNDLLDRLPRTLPVLVVAAGPSLNKNINLVRELKNRALIVCTDRAVQTMNREQIIPDLVITVDATKPAYFLQAEITEETPLLCSFQANRANQEAFDGRNIYFHAWIGEEMLPGVGHRVLMQGDLGGNVAGGAFITFLEYGFQTIIFIGQDLALVDGQSHSDGSDLGTLKGDEIEIEGIDGRPVYSHRDWISFRDKYEQMIIRYPKARVIDATEGGALIHGTEVMTLQQVIDCVCTEEYDVDAMLRDLPRAQTVEEHEQTLALMEHWIEELDLIIDRSTQLAPLCDQLLRISKYQDFRDIRVRPKHQQMGELRADIYRTQINELLEHMWIREIDLIPDPLFVFQTDQEAIDVFTQAYAYYKVLPDNCRSLQEELRKVIDLAREKDEQTV